MAQTMVVEYKDLPFWVKDALKRLGYRKALTVEIGTSHSFPGVISDNSFRTYITNVGPTSEKPEGKIVVTTGAFGGQAPWNTKGQRMVNGPANVKNFPAHVQVLRHDTGWKCPTATLYVHPDYMAKALPITPEPDDIPWAVQVVLYATRTLKSSYGGVKDFRKREAMKDAGITSEEFDQGRELAIASGYLRKNKAITAKGRNVIPAGIYSFFDLKREG